MELKLLINHKPRGKKGEGRTVKFTPTNIPVDLADDLKLYKDIYAEMLGDKVSLESMLRSWMKIVAEQQPDVEQVFYNKKKLQADFRKAMQSSSIL